MTDATMTTAVDMEAMGAALGFPTDPYDTRTGLSPMEGSPGRDVDGEARSEGDPSVGASEFFYGVTSGKEYRMVLTTHYKQQLLAWSKSHRNVRRMLRNMSWIQRVRQRPKWRKQWANRVLVAHTRNRLASRRVTFYLTVKFKIFNPRHNRGDGIWHAVETRYGPFGPDRVENIGSYIDDDLIRNQTNATYSHDVVIEILGYTYEITNETSLLDRAVPLDEIMLRQPCPLNYQFLTYGDGIHEGAYAVLADNEECVIKAVAQWMLNPPTARPIKTIPQSVYDKPLPSCGNGFDQNWFGVLSEFAQTGSYFDHEKFRNPNSRPGTKAKTSEETVGALLRVIRDRTDPSSQQGFSIQVIKKLCVDVLGVNLVVLDKKSRLIERVYDCDSQNNHRATLAFYAFHGHLYLLATKDALQRVVQISDEVRTSTLHDNAMVPSDNTVPNDGVYEEHNTFDTSYEYLPGVHVLKNSVSLRSHILEMMNTKCIEPKIIRMDQGSVSAFEFKNDNHEVVKIVADPHPYEQLDHTALRKCVEAYGFKYSPDRAMGSVVMQLMQRLARDRRKLTAAEKEEIVHKQNYRCNCCDMQLVQTNGKWKAEFDHITPLADGGQDVLENIQALTAACHREKTSEENERGYFGEEAYASQFNGHVFDQMIAPSLDQTQNFDAIQHVEARWMSPGMRVQLKDHPYWKDGTHVCLEYDQSGRWGIALDSIQHPGETSVTRMDAVKDYKTRVLPKHIVWNIRVLRSSLNCPEQFAELYDFYVQKGVEDLDSVFHYRKIDVNRCRANAMYYSQHEWPVFCAMDEIKPFDGNVRCGLYFVTASQSSGPFERNGMGWFTQPLVEYGLECEYLTHDDIKLQLVPTTTLPPNFFRKHLDALDKMFDGHSDLVKLSKNVFIGLMARSNYEHRSTYLSVEAAEVAEKFVNNKTGYTCHVSKFGALDDGRDVWQAEFVLKQANAMSKYPIYKQILEAGEYIQLDDIRRTVESCCGGFALEYATDAVMFVVPKEYAWTGRTIATGSVVYSCPELGIDLSPEFVEYSREYIEQVQDMFWDDEKRVRAYKWETKGCVDDMRLKMTHHRRYRTCIEPNVCNNTWSDVVVDGVDLAPTGDWTAVANKVTSLGHSVNIDGPPGTGKSSLTRAIIGTLVQTHGEDCIKALAPTNVAARNLGSLGQTLASFALQWTLAQKRGGKTRDKVVEMLSKLRYIVIDEISMLNADAYALLQTVRRCFDFRQLPPVNDKWSGDYKSSSALHYLCDGNRIELTVCRRSDVTLFNMYMNADDLDITKFPVKTLTKLHVAYLHSTRIEINKTCMEEFQVGETRRVPKLEDGDLKAEKTQDMTIFVGMPLVCYRTQKKGQVILNSEIWRVAELGTDNVTLQRALEEVDRESGKTQDEMPTVEMEYDQLPYRFWPGYCITVHASQGKTFRVPYTIHNFKFRRMQGAGRFVALSRATSHDLVQIANDDPCDVDDEDYEDGWGDDDEDEIGFDDW